MAHFGLVLPSSTPAAVKRPWNPRLDLQVSHTQFEIFDLCWRKWWFQRIAGIKPPPRPYFVTGNCLHEVAERYLQRHPDIYPPNWDAGLLGPDSDWVRRMATIAIESGIWQPDPTAFVEYRFAILLAGTTPTLCTAEVEIQPSGRRVIVPPTLAADGRPLTAAELAIPYTVGFIDWYHRDSGLVRIHDHKSSKNRTYAKKKKDVAGGRQLPTYALVPFSELPHCHEVEGAYNLFLKDPEAKTPAYQVRDTITRARALTVYEELCTAATTMQQLRQDVPCGPRGDSSRGSLYRQVPGAVDVHRGNDAAVSACCDAFGGCPYKDACFGYTPIDRLTKRLDDAQKTPPAAPATARAKTPHLTFGLVLPTLRRQPTGLGPSLTHQPAGDPMPFFDKTPSPAKDPGFSMEQDAYLRDPDRSDVQYRARIIGLETDNSTGAQVAYVALWPDANVEPDWDTLDEGYQLDPMSTESLMKMPALDTKITGYADMYAIYQKTPPPWSPKATAAAPATQQQPDRQFGLVTGAPPATAGGIPKHWDWVLSLIGKAITVTVKVGSSFHRILEEVSESGVTLAGIVAPVAWDRITSIAEVGAMPEPASMQPTPAANTQQVATQATLFNPQVTEQQQKIAERKAMAAPLVGKFCHIQISGIPVAHRLKLVDVTDEGLHFDNIKDIVPWEKVEEFKDGNDVPIPGDDKDKARVEKNHDLAALTLGGALSRIRSICEEAMAKKTPSIGKRDIAKLMETLDVAVQRLQEGGQTAEAVEVSWVKPSDNEALTSQFREAFNTAIESAINGLKASVQQAF